VKNRSFHFFSFLAAYIDFRQNIDESLIGAEGKPIKPAFGLARLINFAVGPGSLGRRCPPTARLAMPASPMPAPARDFAGLPGFSWDDYGSFLRLIGSATLAGDYFTIALRAVPHVVARQPLFDVLLSQMSAIHHHPDFA
jgi:hypothetical protein